MCCTEAITRILMFVANFAFLCVGVALLVIGILFTVHFTNYTEAIPESYQVIQYVPILAIVVGSIIFIISFLGCCGTLRSSTLMLTSYASILFIIFLLQVGLGIFGLLQIKNEDDLRREINNKTNMFFGTYNKTRDISGVIDLIQQNLQCCGADNSQFWPSNNFAIPNSCYKDYSTTGNRPFQQGCSEAMFKFVTESIEVIAIVAIVISVTEVVGAILALCLANCIRSEETKNGYRY